MVAGKDSAIDWDQDLSNEGGRGKIEQMQGDEDI